MTPMTVAIKQKFDSLTKKLTYTGRVGQLTLQLFVTLSRGSEKKRLSLNN